jgi:hypothetical protein
MERKSTLVHFKTKSKPLKHASNTPSHTDLQKDIIPTEDHEQMIFVQWFRRTYLDVRILSVPNGGHRHPAVAAKLKATGVTAGVPDLFIPAWRLWVEMKRAKGGSVSAEQKDWISYLEACGYTCMVAKGADQAKEKILGFVPIK